MLLSVQALACATALLEYVEHLPQAAMLTEPVTGPV